MHTIDLIPVNGFLHKVKYNTRFNHEWIDFKIITVLKLSSTITSGAKRHICVSTGDNWVHVATKDLKKWLND